MAHKHTLQFNGYILGWSNWVVVLRPTQHKIGHFGDVSQAHLLVWYEKTKPNTTEVHNHQYYNTK